MKTKFIRILLACILVLTAVIVLFGCANAKQNEISDKEITIVVDVIDDVGNTKTFTIKTNRTTLRGALEQENLVKGDEAQYGLYVKEVCGISAIYEVNGAYWSFSKSGEYLMTGVDTTMISDGDHYEITYTK